jgi:hypothetical protein
MAREARSKIVQQEVAYESFHTAAKNNHDHVNQIYEQGHNQAKRWFQFGLIAASIGFVIILGGAVIALFTAANIAGVLTSIASIVPGAISALYMNPDNKAQAPIGSIQTDNKGMDLVEPLYPCIKRIPLLTRRSFLLMRSDQKLPMWIPILLSQLAKLI